MKLGTLAVITLVVFGCSLASAQTRSIYFWEAGTDILYCNFDVITSDSGGVVAGYDDASLCPVPANSALVGFDATVPKKDGLPAHGKGIIVGDSIYDASCSCYSGLQWTVWISDKYSKIPQGINGPYTWLGVVGSYTGTFFGDNYGWTTPTRIPSKNKIASRTTAGILPTKLRK